MHVLPLGAIERSEEAVVHLLAGPAPLRTRLEELGIHPGARLTVLASGSPCIVRLSSGTRLCLRTDEAGSVLVRIA
jgi:Fe2+ transport system protein FeoA